MSEPPRDGAAAPGNHDHGLVERQIQAINRFPDQNPHPVLRVHDDGQLTYANITSEPIRHALGVEVGDILPVELINHGPVVAGVIGSKRTIYDVRGDTVNLASRMESLSEAGRIQVTQQVHDRLEDRFSFEPRGHIEVKGKGLMPTWFLTGRLTPPR